jgi:general secretion pathway protein N
VIVIVFVVMILAAIFHAPASWLDELAARATHDRLRLAQASGTLWQGQASVTLRLDGSAAGPGHREERGSASPSGLVLPQALQWRINPFALLAGGPAFELSMQGLDRPLRLAWRDQVLQVPAGQLDLPRLDFAALGSPWNSLEPSARLQLRWTELLIATESQKPQASTGRINVAINDLAARISPVQPLGSYDWQFDLSQIKRWELRTIEGVLDLRAVPEAGRGIRIEARPKAAEETRLRPLLSLMGTREADATVMRLLP